MEESTIKPIKYNFESINNALDFIYQRSRYKTPEFKEEEVPELQLILDSFTLDDKDLFKATISMFNSIAMIYSADMHSEYLRDINNYNEKSKNYNKKYPYMFKEFNDAKNIDELRPEELKRIDYYHGFVDLYQFVY